MTDIAEYVRIFDLRPTDDLVQKRTASIKDIGQGILKLRVRSEVLEHANGAANGFAAKGQLSPAFQDAVVNSIRKKATAFVLKDNELEVVICAQVAILQLLSTTKPSNSARTVAEFYAAGLWSALSFQTPKKEVKLESLRRDLLEASRKLIAQSADLARVRSKVDSPVVAVAPEAGLTADILNKALDPTVNALRDNAICDREELDILWFSLGDWSSLLNAKISALNPATAAVASGLEMGAMLRNFPAQAHLNIAMRNVSGGEPMSLNDLLKALSPNRASLTRLLDGDFLASKQLIFPLLSGLFSGKNSLAGSAIKRDFREWTARALLEINLYQACFKDKEV